MVFDNDAWRKTGESVQGGGEEINEEIVRRFGILFGAGEIQQGQEVAESVVDSSEIINTLSGGGVPRSATPRRRSKSAPRAGCSPGFATTTGKTNSTAHTPRTGSPASSGRRRWAGSRPL